MRTAMGDQPASTEPSPAVARSDSPASLATATSGLAERYFALQDQRPGRLRDVELFTMDPALRSLLFTDGTVTRMLEAQALSRVSVDVVAQSSCSPTEPVARHLEAPQNSKSVRRRVTISIDGFVMPVIWAESHILPERLPAGFISLLDDTPEGIGESLQQIKLEGWREMLWFGLDSPPDWDDVAPDAAPAFLTRLYRVITQGRPALLISESFAVERRSGCYQLASPS
jgi:chorismate-pyruvate lyase